MLERGRSDPDAVRARTSLISVGLTYPLCISPLHCGGCPHGPCRPRHFNCRFLGGRRPATTSMSDSLDTSERLGWRCLDRSLPGLVLRLSHFYQIVPGLVKKTIVFIARGGSPPRVDGRCARCQLGSAKSLTESSRIAFQFLVLGLTAQSLIRFPMTASRATFGEAMWTRPIGELSGNVPLTWMWARG